MHLNEERYGIELYDLLECVNYNIPKKRIKIETLLNWAERYIDFDSAIICTIKTTAQLLVEFRYAKGVPKKWINEYCNNDYARDDPIIQYALSVGGVFSWHDALSSFDTLRGREIIARARSNGLHGGHSYSMPISNTQNKEVKLLSLANVSSKPDITCQYIIATLGTTIFYFMENPINNNDFTSKTLLNNNELQVLAWSAKGKSIWEISKIIDTSERTVKYRLNNTYRKLQASNKTQAVSTALKLGLLR